MLDHYTSMQIITSAMAWLLSSN